MKLTIKTFASLLCLAAASCASDPSPFSTETPSQEKEDAQAFLNLTFDVADSQETRAVGDELKSTANEKSISNVDVYIFDAEGKQLNSYSSLKVTDGVLSNQIKMTPGVYTLYVIARGLTSASNMNPASITDLEAVTFSSAIDDIAHVNDSGNWTCVMIGKSQPIQIVKGDNNLNIMLTRVAAKAQVKFPTAGITFDGTKYSALEYKVVQSAEKMRVTPAKDVNAGGTADNGTYSNFTASRGASNDYISSVTEFASNKCVYMAENEMTDKRTGNTTFLSIKMKATPPQMYTYDSSNGLGKTTFNSADGTFYAVGHTNEDLAVNSYCLDSDNEILLFGDFSQANAYCTYLNAQYHNGYGVIQFTNGYVYYRVNIKHGEVYKAQRNTFYKVNVEGISGFGYHTEVIPKKADTGLESTDSNLKVTFQVQDWDGMDLPVTLN